MIAGVLVAALAAALACGPSPAAAAGRLTPSPGRRPRRSFVGWVAGGVSSVLALSLLVGLRATLWAVALAITATTVWWLWRGHRRRRAEARAADECAQAARVLSSLLRSGNIPRAALAEAATDFPVLAPAASAARLGTDIGRELERAAEEAGRQGMRSVAAAWRLSERTGAPIADVLFRVADTLRRQRQLDAVVATELAAARTSGYIMATLPFLAVGLGLAAGVNTVAYLVTEPIGQVLVLTGVTLTSAGVVWVDRLARTGGRVQRGRS